MRARRLCPTTVPDCNFFELSCNSFHTVRVHSPAHAASLWPRTTQRDWDNAHLINAAHDIHADDPAVGYRFTADELPSRGIIAGGNHVARLCSQQHIWSVFAKKKGLNRKTGPPAHDDLVSRRFTAQVALVLA